MQTNTTNHPAKFAFFYLLALVALVMTALSTGMIIFQIINKTIADVLENYSGNFSSSQLKFAISALIIAAPIFYVTMRQIFKALFTGDLSKDSGIRKWLSYFVLLVSSVVMIGWLIGTINVFLDGDLTLKFALKALTALGISAIVFSFFLYDIKREQVEGVKDGVVRVYFYGTLLLVVAAFLGSLFVVESPAETRARKLDEANLSNFNQIHRAMEEYFTENEALPGSLAELRSATPYLTEDRTANVFNDEEYGYNVLGVKKYELCTEFKTSNITSEDNDYWRETWPHEAGDQCVSRLVNVLPGQSTPPRVAPEPAMP